MTVLYFIADYLLYPIIFYIVRYRRHLVEKNLLLSFPNKTPEERRTMEKGFYHQLTYTMVEGVHGMHASRDEMSKRVVFHHVEEVAHDCLQKGGVIFMLGHLGNWEWIAEIHHEVAPYGLVECNVYRKQKNKFFDRLFLEAREKRGGFCTDKNQLLRTMIKQRSEGIKTTYGLVCDQKPSPANAHYWTTFLNQDTSFLQGGEVLSKKFDYPVYYAFITRPTRGHYDIDLQLVTRTPKRTSPNEITEEFARRLEKNILAQPEIWLWSHNRWKWKRNNG